MSPAATEYKKVGYSFFVYLGDDKVECLCTYLPNVRGTMMTRDEFMGFLTQSKVKEGLDEEAIDDFMVKAAAGRAMSNVLIAKGIPPENGRDGYFEYIAEASIIAQHGKDDTTNIDLHNVQTFINVIKGDRIGRLYPPEPGKSGRTVTGATIPAKPGAECVMKIEKNIHTEEDGTIYVADVCGRVSLSMSGISVDEEYIVSGDVDFKVGSIDFNGIVEVRGDVLDDFNVKAEKGLRVTGNIGASRIESIGNIAFCGMDGQQRGTIICGGIITAHFIHESTVECLGDLIVEAEIIQSNIRCLGRVIVNKGGITGGSCIALGGIEAAKVGAPAGVNTTLKTGVAYYDLDVLQALLSDLGKCRQELQAATETPDLERLALRCSEITSEITEIRNAYGTIANPKINVKKALYEKSHISIGITTESTIEMRDGPVSIIENTVEGGLRYIAMTSLDVPASDIEKAIIMAPPSAT